jgi:hypothetical protein
MLSERRERLVARHTDKKWNREREEEKKRNIYRSSKYAHILSAHIRTRHFSFSSDSFIRDIEYHSR